MIFILVFDSNPKRIDMDIKQPIRLGYHRPYKTRAILTKMKCQNISISYNVSWTWTRLLEDGEPMASVWNSGCGLMPSLKARMTLFCTTTCVMARCHRSEAIEMPMSYSAMLSLKGEKETLLPLRSLECRLARMLDRRRRRRTRMAAVRNAAVASRRSLMRFMVRFQSIWPGVTAASREAVRISDRGALCRLEIQQCCDDVWQ